MSLRIYKPNSKNTGSCFSFQLGKSKKSPESMLFVSAIQQGSWNEKEKRGSFKENAKNPEKNISVKFNEFEIGGILSAIRGRIEFKAFHSFQNENTQISFSPFIDQKNNTGAVLGFWFSITRNNGKFSIPLSLGECETIASFMDFCLKTIFSERLKIEKAAYEANKGSGSQGQSNNTQIQESAQETTQESQEQATQDDNPFA